VRRAAANASPVQERQTLYIVNAGMIYISYAGTNKLPKLVRGTLL
jgi:hypothetical protein